MSKCKVIRDPETVAVLQNAPDGSDHPGVLRKPDGAMVHYWRNGRKLRCREVSKTEALDISLAINDWHERQGAAASDPFVAGVVQHLAESFGATSPAMMDELAGPAPDLFSHEVATRAHVLSAAGAGIKGQWEAFDRTLEAPECPTCRRRMNRQGERVKMFTTMVGKVRVKRRYYRCPECKEGLCPFDRQLRLVDKNCTPGAAYLMLKVAAPQGFDKASETLQELSGVKLPASTLHRKVAALGKEIIEFEEKQVVEGQPQADVVYVGVDGAGVPMIRKELEGRSGKQEDGSARTRECKVATAWTATQTNRKTGRPQKDKGSGLTSAGIDSAANPGAGKASQTASRLYRLYRRVGVFLARTWCSSPTARPGYAPSTRNCWTVAR